MKCVLHASKGHIDILKVMPSDTNWHPAVGAAIKAGQMQVLKWFQENNKVHIDNSSAVCNAAHSGKMDILLWLQKEFDLHDWNFEAAMWYAVNIGNLEMIQYFKNSGVEVDPSICAEAAEQGHFEILKWMHENQCDWDSDTTTNAAKYGNLSILQWLIEVNCPIDATNLEEGAIQGGNLQLIKWVKSNLNIDWIDSKNCKLAIANGHWDILEWLLDNECNYDDSVLKKALKKGASLPILERLYTSTVSIEKLCKTAGAYGRLEFIIWLANKNATYYEHTVWNNAYYGAVKENQFDVMKKIYSTYCVCTEKVSICTNLVPAYKWLRKQECAYNKQ